jgi:hypothetical protein
MINPIRTAGAIALCLWLSIEASVMETPAVQ